MTEEIDSGPIYMKQTISLEGSLEMIFKEFQSQLKMIFKFVITTLYPNQTGETYLFKRLKIDNELNLESSLEKIYDKIRMLV